MAFRIQNSSATPPKQASNDYVRPSDWPAITDPGTGEYKFLICDTDSVYDITMTVASGTTAYIEWGDGVTDTIVGSGTLTTTTHTYTQGTGTSCSRGYTTFIIRIYTSAPGGITTLSVKESSSFEPLGSYTGLLEAYYGPWASSTGWLSSISYLSVGYGMLEYVKFVGTNNAISSISILAPTLAKIDLGDTPILNTLSLNGTNIRELTISQSATGLHTLKLYNCFSLQSVTLPTTITSSAFNWGATTSATACFSGCTSLIRVKMPNVTSYNAAGGFTPFGFLFNSCVNLQSVEFGSLPVAIQGTTQAFSMASMFNGCQQLKSVNFAVDLDSNSNFLNINASSMFAGCFNLIEVTLPANFNPSTTLAMFQNCYNLMRFRAKSPMPLLTNMNNMFVNCYGLKDLTLPPSVASTITCASTFFNCYSLESITLPYNVTNLSQAFSNCLRLRTADISSSISVTTLSSAFLQSGLESVTLPSVMDSCTTLASAFSSCSKLKSVMLPSSMTSLTTISGAFSSCFELTSVIMPTSYGTFITTGLNSPFFNCYKLQSLDLSGISAVTSISAVTAVASNAMLSTLKLPSGQMSGLSTNAVVSNMFSLNSYVKEIVNFDKIGSSSTSGNVLVYSGGSNNYMLNGMTFSCRLSQMLHNGNASLRMRLTRIRHLNTGAGQWGGSSPQINISYTSIGYTELVQYFNDIAATGTYTGKTINITGCTGASSLTSADRLILTSKGWTITG